jgi:hypothetical protein
MAHSPLAIVTLGMLGGSGPTYLAGGAEITVSTASTTLDIAAGESVELLTGINLDLADGRGQLDVMNDGNSINLQG